MTSTNRSELHSRISIITIGTEVVTGEIVNANAQWLAAALDDLGYEVLRHVTVPDETLLMLEAFEFCAQDSGLLMITGGLGPTTDDFTRDVVARWTGRSLEFDAASWQGIQDRLNAMQVVVAAANQQQCFFPAGAQILKNPAGTANAFFLEHGAVKVFCLPGPPSEIKAIWDAGGETLLRDGRPASKRQELLLWHCMGLSESRLGEIVEEALQGSGYKTGYRPHIPYVDVKVWVPSGVTPSDDVYLQKLEQAIAPWVVCRQGADIAALVSGYLSRLDSVGIYDGLSGGILAERLGPLLRALDPERHRIYVQTTFASDFLVDSDAAHSICLVAGRESGTWEVTWRSRDISKSETFKFERRITKDTRERFLRFAVERTLIALSLWLKP